jgi:hypothetical protein
LSYLSYLCLLVYIGVQHILCCVFALFFLVLCTLCCQFFWIVHFLLAQQYFTNVYFKNKFCWFRNPIVQLLLFYLYISAIPIKYIYAKGSYWLIQFITSKVLLSPSSILNFSVADDYECSRHPHFLCNDLSSGF